MSPPPENGVFLFRCIRCCATFVLRRRTEKYGEVEQWKHLELDTCTVCGKGSVEYVGIAWVTHDDQHR